MKVYAMTLSRAIAVLDDVIPEPENRMVDQAHMEIAIAWETVRNRLFKLLDSEEWSEE